MNVKEREVMYQTFLKENQNIITGSLASIELSVDDIAQISAGLHPGTESVTEDANTTIIVIKHHGHHLEVRVVKEVPTDPYAFINECMVREHLIRIPSKKVMAFVPNTVAMNFQLGYIISTYREASPLTPLTFGQYESLFKTLWDMERSQLFARSLTRKNLAIHEGQVILTDVSMLVPFDPTKDYNHEGLTLPQVHMIERLEKGVLLEAWGKMEVEDSLEKAIENIKIEKAAALIVYMDKQRYLQTHQGSITITAWMTGLIDDIKKFLVGPEECWQEYMSQKYRSYVKDMVDELDAPAIASSTLTKLDFLIQYAQNDQAKDRYLRMKNEALLKPIVDEA
jgi:hypothetical protein